MRLTPLLLAGFFVAATVATAAPIGSLYNTGVDNSGAPLPNFTVGDPHYTLTSVPAGTTTTLVRTQSGGYPVPPYTLDDSLSAWIGPANDSQVDGPVGWYDYRTTFSLTGLIPGTASITGRIGVDDFLGGIVLNGANVAYPSNAGFSYWEPFSIGTGSNFQNGTNTLDFLVYNTGGPTALRVEMTGSAQPSSVPDSAIPLWMQVGVFAAILVVASRPRRLRPARA